VGRPVEVWSIDLRQAGPALLSIANAESLLAPEDENKVSGMADREAAAERLAATVAIRILIEGLAGPDYRAVGFETGRHGKPHLPGCWCQFSLSHVSGFGLAALSEAPVGIDVERLRAVSIDALRRSQIEAGAQHLDPGQPLPAEFDERRFFTAWTRLEAVAKADGRGIGEMLTLIGVGPHRQGAPSNIGEAEGFRSIAMRHVVADLPLLGDLIGAVAGSRDALFPTTVRQLPSDVGSLRSLLTRQRKLGETGP